MASLTDHAVLHPEEDLDSSSCEDEDDVEEDDEEDDVSPTTSSAGNDAVPVPVPVASSSAAAVTIALPAISNGDASATPILTAGAVISANPEIADRRVMIDLRNEPMAVPPEEKKPVALDDSRKLFQRLWTDEDEIELLQGFLDYSTQRGTKTTHHHGQNDTALFYDQIKPKLQLEFNKNQLVEKLRRLKKKYRNVLNRISSGKELSFKSPHDQVTFEISRKIWTNLGGGVDTTMDDDDPSPSAALSNFIVEVKGEEAGGFAFERRMYTSTPMTAVPTPRSRKRSRPKPEPRIEERRFLPENSTPIKDGSYSNYGGIGHNPSNANGNVQGLIEETVKNCLPPVLKDFLGFIS